VVGVEELLDDWENVLGIDRDATFFCGHKKVDFRHQCQSTYQRPHIVSLSPIGPAGAGFMHLGNILSYRMSVP
jgi:hypothetical protein